MTDTATLAAFYELSQAKARYCRTLDTRDWSGFADLMTEDIELDVTDGNPGAAVITGRDAAVEMIQSTLTNAQTAHQVYMPEIQVKGEEAQVIWAMQDRLIWQDGPSLTGYGHYHERWVRYGGEWKLAALKLTRLIMDFDS